MKNPNRKTVTKLEELPNLGKTMASYLQSIGIEYPQSLIGKDPFELYKKLCNKNSKIFDPCVIDTFMSVVDFMEGGEPKVWWAFTSERKIKFQKKYQLRSIKNPQLTVSSLSEKAPKINP